jgi:hypothetical protein
MARKQQRRKGGKSRPRPVAAPPPVAAATPAAAPRPQRVGGEQALVRAVEMSIGGQAVVRGRGRSRYVLESGDAGIPLDRVPYFLSDLRQLVIVGALMVVLLVVAAYVVIPQVTK